jgi:hypothetical protein
MKKGATRATKGELVSFLRNTFIRIRPKETQTPGKESIPDARSHSRLAPDRSSVSRGSVDEKASRSGGGSDHTSALRADRTKGRDSPNTRSLSGIVRLLAACEDFQATLFRTFVLIRVHSRLTTSLPSLHRALGFGRAGNRDERFAVRALRIVSERNSWPNAA